MKFLHVCLCLIILIATSACSKQSIPPKPDTDGLKESPRLVLNGSEFDIIKSHMKKWAVVKGKVFDVFEPKSGKVLNLNMGPNYKRCFKAVIFPGSYSKWAGGKDYLKSLQGKTVIIEGSIEEYMDSPQIIVNSATQLKVE